MINKKHTMYKINLYINFNSTNFSQTRRLKILEYLKWPLYAVWSLNAKNHDGVPIFQYFTK